MSLLSPEYSLLHLLAAALAGLIIGRVTGALAHPERREEQKRATLAARLSTEDNLRRLSPEVRTSIDALVADGKLIEAVRDVRLALDIGLKEAKDVVDCIRDSSSRGARV